MGKKLDIRRDVATRKYRIPNPFWYFIYYAVGRTHLLGAKYHPHFEIIDKLPKKGAAFVIWNHQSRRDHTFLCTALWPRRMSIVCEYNEFFRSHLHWAFKMNRILPKKPFDNSEFVGIKAINSIIMSGGIVALSPEGNSSNFGNNQPIALGTGKLLKHYKVPVYMLHVEGSYLTNNKNFDEDRLGKVNCKLYKLFSKEDLETLSDSEIEDKINLEFKFDDYEWNKTARVKFKHKSGMCTHLDDMCFKCPKCGEEFTMVAEGDEIKCIKCGNGAHMDEYYDLHPYEDAVIPDTPSIWVQEERMDVIKEIREDDNYRFEAEVDLGILPNDHYITDKKTSEKVGEGKIIIDHSGFHFEGKKNDEDFRIDIDYKNIYTFNIPVDLSRIAVYYKGEYHEFAPHVRAKAVKALLLVEEMHRLHVNAWKNFPWFDYMYEPYKKEGEDK